MKKILFVDDELGLLSLYRLEFSEEGYEVILATNGKEALEKVHKSRPDIIVMDIRMPMMDGIEAMNILLGENRQIPIILNTAYSEYKQNYMTWGAEAYVVKSSDLSELKQKVQEVCEKREKAFSPSPGVSKSKKERMGVRSRIVMTKAAV